MSTINFSELALLWPFGNELDQTVFVYKEHERGAVPPPNDGMAKFTLSTALGHIVMDDSVPEFHLVGHKDNRYHQIKPHRHIVYIGGGAINEIVRKFLDKCKEEHLCGIVELPTTTERPRSMTVGSTKLWAEYYDAPKSYKQIKTDYGLVFLAPNPFAKGDERKTLKALLVAGIHSYGTLAAAQVISHPRLSEHIVRRIMANSHLPPHMLGLIEVVVKAQVNKKNGRLRKLSERDIMHVIVNGTPLPPDPKKLSLKAMVGLSPKEVEVNRNMKNLAITFSRRIGDGSELAVPGTTSLPESFFDFSDYIVIVVSPHSDDSVIGCGGLIYYLRNKRLWEDRGDCPPVHVLVMTASPRGVEDKYFKHYRKLVGVRTYGNYTKFKSEIRRNESKAEAYLLDTETHWLDLDARGPDVDNREKIGQVLEEKILTEGILKDKTKVLFLIPHHRDEHETHRRVAQLVLKFLRACHEKEECERKSYEQACAKAEVWAYESPWVSLEPNDINVILPLDKHAIFAKCQAIAMHQSQEVRTRYSDIARTQGRHHAETLPELVFGFAGGGLGWDYVEAFESRDWKLKAF